jgi:hypothetical protein
VLLKKSDSYLDFLNLLENGLGNTHGQFPVLELYFQYECYFLQVLDDGTMLKRCRREINELKRKLEKVGKIGGKMFEHTNTRRNF